MSDTGELSVAQGKRKAAPIIIDSEIIEINSSDGSDDDKRKMLSTPPTSQSTEVVKTEPPTSKYCVFDENWIDNNGLTDLDIPVIASISEFVLQDVFNCQSHTVTNDNGFGQFYFGNQHEADINAFRASHICGAVCLALGLPSV
ncbi:hypothetical protein HYPSUDRAFT_209837 [Hypholoma sublateritium FD-334 SS-4]|uniref:Alpha-type protein kinase domain-containing protein n=1 Tax=Hypholoma sublateritium (strain FD-334 SS-4) TaxID=945553 RepID=A0A0D2N8Q9_HYPSF|nr:hypothetical protein HYPSUDRAFT_209837 [Hypholoma sublateritium FD-334 SS-4]